MPTVQLKITPDVVRTILRLPPDYQVTGARMDTVTDQDSGWSLDLMVLDVHAPSAPEDAREMWPRYDQDMLTRDPIWLSEVTWTHHDGTRTVQPFTRPPDSTING